MLPAKDGAREDVREEGEEGPALESAGVAAPESMGEVGVEPGPCLL